MEDTYFPSTSKDWKKFELNNEISLNILYVPHNTKKIQIAYKSKHNLPGLFKGITSNHKEDFHCLNCFHIFRTKNKLEEHKKICENHNYCNVEMPNEDNKTIKYNQGEKSIKLPFTIYTDLECLLEK